jgi:hypothetical protein
VLKRLALVCLTVLAPVQAQRLEVSPVGWLSLAAGVAGVLLGGQARLTGFNLSLSLGRENYLGFTPYVQFTRMPDLRVDPYTAVGWGLTLGGTVLVSHTATGRVEAYEQKHVEGWLHYGLGYAVMVFAEACTYDPLSAWGQAMRCPPQRPQYDLPPRTEAFFLRW